LLPMKGFVHLKSQLPLFTDLVIEAKLKVPLYKKTRRVNSFFLKWISLYSVSEKLSPVAFP